MKLRVLMEPRHGATYDRVVAMAKATEEAGLDAFFRNDHYLGIDSTDPEYRPTDSWTTLAGVALETTRIKFGTLMTAGTFRHPAWWHAEATVDQMSAAGSSEASARAGASAAQRLRIPSPRSASALTGWTSRCRSSTGCGRRRRASRSASTAASGSSRRP